MINKLHQSKLLGKIFHTLDHCIQRELTNCETILDLGCGPSSPIKNCKNIKHSLGVEAFLPYLEESKKKHIHNDYLLKKIEEIDFQDNSFDAVMMIEVLEHLPEKLGYEILNKAERWASKKVIISTPNGYFPMDAVDNNEHQRHLSGWTVDTFKQKGFKVYGLSGMKCIYYNKNTVHSLINEGKLTSNIRFKPKSLFYILNGFLQIITYYVPQKAFGILAVKEKK